MKHFLVRGLAGMVRLVVGLGVCWLASPGWAQNQNNSWTSNGGGNWEDASWSLGAIPGTNQDILLTNYGWKAVQITAGTARNFPQSLNVNSIVISSPTNSFNTLLLNYVGVDTPLTIKTLSVASNSAMTMYSSGLQIDGPNGQGMTVGGEFNQNDSVVGGNQLNVGYTGPGVYNFNGGYLAISQLWVGGAYRGVLYQNGGTNAFGITHLDGGDYVLSNGFFGSTIYFNGGQFWQEGGVLDLGLTIFHGNYLLEGGVHLGDAAVPSSDGFSSGNAGMWQTGGTNYGSLDIGSFGSGSYTLSNGVSFAGGVTVDYEGAYYQWGGGQVVANTIYIGEKQIAQNAYQGGNFYLHGGQVSSSGMFILGYYAQDGGTNLVAGDVNLGGVQTSLSLSGGLLTANNLAANPGFYGGILMTGGTLVVTNELRVGGGIYFPQWQGFMGGGQLIVSDISLTPQGKFSCRDGVIVQSGTLSMANASLYAGSNEEHFGRLCLSDEGNTNSGLYMPVGASVVNFTDSSSVTWSNDAVLIVEGWSGSLNGGGQQEIIFGSNAAALTAGQLSQIQFHNPAGLPAGTYPARILSTGEIVPKSTMAIPASVALEPQGAGMQVTLQGEAGRTYCIEISTDLVHWMAWTNQINTNGRICVVDAEAKNCPARFYRARLLP